MCRRTSFPGARPTETPFAARVVTDCHDILSLLSLSPPPPSLSMGSFSLAAEQNPRECSFLSPAPGLHVVYSILPEADKIGEGREVLTAAADQTHTWEERRGARSFWHQQREAVDVDGRERDLLSLQHLMVVSSSSPVYCTFAQERDALALPTKADAANTVTYGGHFCVLQHSVPAN